MFATAEVLSAPWLGYKIDTVLYHMTSVKSRYVAPTSTFDLVTKVSGLLGMHGRIDVH